MSPHVRPLNADEASALRSARLRALAHAPQVFAASLEHTSTAPPEFWSDWVAESVAGEHQRTFVSTDANGNWLGMALVRDSHHRPGEATLTSMWVEPNARGHGVARALCEACIIWARAHKHACVNLSAVRSNDAARRAFERAGFIFVKMVAFEREDGTILEKLVMSHPLEGVAHEEANSLALHH